MDEILKKILNAAALAPSGENCQPWQVKLSQNKIDLFNDPSKDTSLYNFGQKGSMSAVGAFLENLIVASKALGLDPQIVLFPNKANENWIATINFSGVEAKPDKLYSSIFKRSTNRKLYKKTVFSEEQLDAIRSSGPEVGDVEVKLIKDSEQIRILSDPISLNERLIFENEYLHNFFYDHLRWTKEEDKKYRNGFFVKTLELKIPQKFFLKLLRSWKLTQFAQKIGISRQIAKDNAKNYASASVLGVITIPTNSAQDFVLAGRAMERVWLKITSMGLSMQPMTGVLFFMQNILANQTNQFSQQQIKAIQNAFQQIKNAFEPGNRTISLLFRIGDGGEPSARSSRFDLSEILLQ